MFLTINCTVYKRCTGSVSLRCLLAPSFQWVRIRWDRLWC